MENVRFLQGVKQYFCTKALDVILGDAANLLI